MDSKHFCFHEWTPERHALFVDYRMRGMHTDWAAFWALVDRERTQVKFRKGVYSAEQMEDIIRQKGWAWTAWNKPMDTSEHHVPDELMQELRGEQVD